MRIEDLEKEAKDAVKKFPFIKTVEVVEKHRAAIKLRLYISENFYIQTYYNIKTKTTNFVAILGGQRIFGRDCVRDNWHLHPFHDPDSHNFSSEGTKKTTLTGFLEELQEVIEKEELL
ncbi:MAG: hypothetical protein ACFFD2_30510 [Promethearchaeota archaeon]